MLPLIPILSLTLSLLAFTGCSTLVGNVKPVDEKSESYGVADLAKQNPDWMRLDARAQTGAEEKSEVSPTEVSDVAFQSRRTAAIISLNSSCREGREGRGADERDLRAVTNLLLLGITEVSFRTERDLFVQNTPALETTVQGRLNGEEMRIRTVVLRRGSCIYDLLYVSRPRYFEQNEADFSQFVASLRLKG